MQKIEHYVDHVAVVLDRSGSMNQHTHTVVKVVDGLVKHLAEQSKISGHETRFTLVTFDDVVERIIWDMDVLRVPSIAGRYEPRGRTALMDATMQAVTDLEAVPQYGGDHAFLLFVVSDGHENASMKVTAKALSAKITGLPDNWTMGAMVPDFLGVNAAKNCGFPAGNVTIWTTTSQYGMEEVAKKVTDAHTAFVAQRQSGKRGTKHLFAPDPTKINDDAVAALGMTPLHPSRYDLHHVAKVEPKTEMMDYIQAQQLPWGIGKVFYQLQKDELIAPDKELALVKTGGGAQVVYMGREIRQLLSLPDDKKVRVAPGAVRGWYVYVQSKAANRHVQPGGLLIRK